MVDMKRRSLSTLLVATCVCVLGAAGCSSSRPPTGKRLRLKGAKGAICTYDRECASDKCLGRRCTEKIEKVGLGGECTGDDYCQKGFRCDVTAKKCTPKINCDKFSDKLRKCIAEVYISFKPKEAGKLKRMRARARKRFYRKRHIHRILFKRLCRLTRRGTTYKKSLALQRALKQSNCSKFAAYYYAGAR
jgi:hypothetical protein